MIMPVLAPLLTDIRSIKTEIQTVQRQLSGTTISDSLRDRLLDLSVTWSNVISPQLVSNGYTAEVNRIQAPLDLLAQKIVSGKITNQERDYIKGLSLEFAQLLITLSKNPKLSISSTHKEKIFPEIPDLPNELAPKDLIGWKSEIKTFLKDHPYEQNVFIMVRYAKQSEPLVKAIVKAVNNFKIGKKKFNAIIAKDHTIVDNLNNPIACLLCCRYGIAIFDSAPRKPEINPNVAYEIGFMNFLQRKCLILKAKKIRTLHSDILAKLYQTFETPSDANRRVKEWLSSIST